MKREKLLRTICLGSAIIFSGVSQAGGLFITGHDSDEHSNNDYMSAGLDYLVFGAAATNASDRGTYNIAYLEVNGENPKLGLENAGWGNVDIFDADIATNYASIFGGNYDAIMVGSGSTINSNANLLASASDFTSYFNDGGNIFVNTDENFGQAWYDFIPSFGTTQNNSISTSGVFTPTTDGLLAGLTDTIVDADITHSYYTGVDTSLFTIFETYDVTGDAVAIGIRDAQINNGGFTASVPAPTSLALFGLGLLGLLKGRKKQNEA